MARENNFVVIERSKVLEQGPEEVKKEDPTVMAFNVTLWPGKATKKPVVPGERMRIKFGRGKSSKAGMDAHVILAEELRDVCVGLSTLRGRDGKYRTSGLSCLITVHPPACTETPAARDVRERALLEPLQRLRHFQAVSIRGTLPVINDQITSQLTRQTFDQDLVLPTIDELIASGDQSSSTGDHAVATARYQRAHEYFHHSAKFERHVFSHPADFAALIFRIMRHSARNWISAGDFPEALEAAQIALNVANQLFRINAPTTTGPHAGPNGGISAAAFRKWTCECIKDGAARYWQRIKAEDIGRCYYYKSISEHVMYGEEGAEQADEDKLTAIGCCVVSETMTEDVPGELLQLDMRTMGKFAGTCKEEEEEGGDEDAWEDEEWEDVEDNDGDSVD